MDCEISCSKAECRAVFDTAVRAGLTLIKSYLDLYYELPYRGQRSIIDHIEAWMEKINSFVIGFVYSFDLFPPFLLKHCPILNSLGPEIMPRRIKYIVYRECRNSKSEKN
jgi:hypothetical protein